MKTPILCASCIFEGVHLHRAFTVNVVQFRLGESKSPDLTTFTVNTLIYIGPLGLMFKGPKFRNSCIRVVHGLRSVSRANIHKNCHPDAKTSRNPGNDSPRFRRYVHSQTMISPTNHEQKGLSVASQITSNRSNTVKQYPSLICRVHCQITQMIIAPTDHDYVDHMTNDNCSPES